MKRLAGTELSAETIEKAVAGDSGAIERVLDYYASYIDSLCREVTTRPDGTKETVINEDMRQQVICKLLGELPNFKME